MVKLFHVMWKELLKYIDTCIWKYMCKQANILNFFYSLMLKFSYCFAFISVTTDVPDSLFGHSIDSPGQFGNLDESITGGICLMGETDLVFALSCSFFYIHNACIFLCLKI